MDSKQVFPLLKLIGVLCYFRVEFFRNAVECEAIVGAEDKFLFQPKAFLEFLDVGKEINDLGGDVMDKFCCFNPSITVS